MFTSFLLSLQLSFTLIENPSLFLDCATAITIATAAATIITCSHQYSLGPLLLVESTALKEFGHVFAVRCQLDSNPPRFSA